MLKNVYISSLFVFLSGLLLGQSIKSEMYKVNQRYTGIESFSANMKISLLNTFTNEVEEEQFGKYVKYKENTLYSLGPYSVLSFGREALHINNSDSLVIYMGISQVSPEFGSMQSYADKVDAYLKIAKDTAIIKEKDYTEIKIFLKYSVDGIHGLTIRYNKSFLMTSMVLHMDTGYEMKFEYSNIQIDKNKLGKEIRRKDYLIGSGENAQLSEQFKGYRFRNIYNNTHNGLE